VLHLRYAGHFNTEPVISTFPQPAEKKENCSKTVTDEYWAVINDFYSITDEASLKRIGPSIIKRSRDILTMGIPTDNPPPPVVKDGEILPDRYAANLFAKSGRTSNALQYGIIPQVPIGVLAQALRDHIDSIYIDVKIPEYKFSTIQVINELYEQTKEYEKILKYLIFVKNDTFYLFNTKHKVTLLVGICLFVKREEIPITDEYYEVGYDSAVELIHYLDFYPGIDEDMKILTKLNVREIYIAEIFVKYSHIDEALFELEYVINQPPTATHVEDFNKMIGRCLNRKAELLPEAQYFPALPLVFEDITDPENTVVLKNGEIAKVYATPFTKGDDDELHNRRKIRVTVKSQHQILTADISCENIFEDDEGEEGVKNFFEDPMRDGSGKPFMHHRGKYGFITSKGLVDQLGTVQLKDGKTDFEFKHSYFGGDKFKLKIKIAAPPYNSIPENSVTLEVWKKYAIRLYGMEENEKNYYPDAKGINERYASAYTEFEIRHNVDCKLPYHKTILHNAGKYDGEIFAGQIKFVDYANELANNPLIEFKEQHDFVNVIGCDRINDLNKKDGSMTYGFYLNYATPGFQHGDYMNTAVIAYGIFRDEGLSESKSLAHEVGHSFALEHVVNILKPHYRHTKVKCIMASGQTFPSNEELRFCKRCNFLIRNSKPNISIWYHIKGISKCDGLE
jgi:hypothetical protein